jgi:hypothetical protein
MARIDHSFVGVSSDVKMALRQQSRVSPLGIPMTYLHCQPDDETVEIFSPHTKVFAQSHGWTVDTLLCGHDAMILLPIT